jgi:hypothetical protein
MKRDGEKEKAGSEKTERRKRDFTCIHISHTNWEAGHFAFARLERRWLEKCKEVVGFLDAFGEMFTPRPDFGI